VSDENKKEITLAEVKQYLLWGIVNQQFGPEHIEAIVRAYAQLADLDWQGGGKQFGS